MKQEMVEEIRQVLLGGCPKMDEEAKPFSGMASVIAETLWESGYRDAVMLLEKIAGTLEKTKEEMTVPDDYQRGYVHGLHTAAGLIAIERLDAADVH